MKKKPSVGLKTGLFLFCMVGVSNAALIDNLDGTLTDTDTNLMWLQDANYAMTSSYDANGDMFWDAAVTWADTLDFAGHDDWRLPTTPVSTGFTGDGELGHLFTVEGVTETTPLLFTNIQPYHGYWTSTEIEPLGTGRGFDSALIYNLNLGRQDDRNKNSSGYYALAVRSADTSVAAVPVPGALWLMGSGLIGLVGLSRRQIKSPAI